jgi:Family of unknown function (DUF5670)
MPTKTFFSIDGHETRWFIGTQRCPSAMLDMFVSDLYCRQLTASDGEAHMLESIALILIILWVLGLVSAYTLGGFIHILLVIAVIVIILRVIQGRRVL